MRRVLIATAVTLSGMALSAPATPAATQHRHFEGDFGVVGPPAEPATNGGRISLDFVFKNKRWSKRKFTPRLLTLVDFENVPLDCLDSPGQPAESTVFDTSIPTLVKLRRTPRGSGQAPPKPNSYSFSFATSFTAFAGTLSGRLYKVNGRGPLHLLGSLTVTDIDFPAPGPTDCLTAGERNWQAS
jgi:hypothetical protein